MVSRPPFVSGSSPNHDGGEPKDNDAAMRCVITHSGRRFIADENSCRAFYYGVRGLTQIAMSPIAAAGKLPINTVGAPGGEMGRSHAGLRRLP
jgi:hypothetical protein